MRAVGRPARGRQPRHARRVGVHKGGHRRARPPRVGIPVAGSGQGGRDVESESKQRDQAAECPAPPSCPRAPRLGWWWPVWWPPGRRPGTWPAARPPAADKSAPRAPPPQPAAPQSATGGRAAGGGAGRRRRWRGLGGAARRRRPPWRRPGACGSRPRRGRTAIRGVAVWSRRCRATAPSAWRGAELGPRGPPPSPPAQQRQDPPPPPLARAPRPRARVAVGPPVGRRRRGRPRPRSRRPRLGRPPAPPSRRTSRASGPAPTRRAQCGQAWGCAFKEGGESARQSTSGTG